MNRTPKFIIYKIICILERILEIPFVIVFTIASIWLTYVWEPLDDILLFWVEDNEIQTSKKTD